MRLHIFEKLLHNKSKMLEANKNQENYLQILFQIIYLNFKELQNIEWKNIEFKKGQTTCT